MNFIIIKLYMYFVFHLYRPNLLLFCIPLWNPKFHSLDPFFQTISWEFWSRTNFLEYSRPSKIRTNTVWHLSEFWKSPNFENDRMDLKNPDRFSSKVRIPKIILFYGKYNGTKCSKMGNKWLKTQWRMSGTCEKNTAWVLRSIYRTKFSVFGLFRLLRTSFGHS